MCEVRGGEHRPPSIQHSPGVVQAELEDVVLLTLQLGLLARWHNMGTERSGHVWSIFRGLQPAPEAYVLHRVSVVPAVAHVIRDDTASGLHMAYGWITSTP